MEDGMITDYIFYRLYRVYKSHGDPPVLQACLYIFCIVTIATIILFILLKEWYNQHGVYAWFLEGICRLFFIIIPQIAILLFCFIVYRKKKIECLKKKYQGCAKNKIISDWMILCIPIYEVVLGVIIYHFLF